MEVLYPLPQTGTLLFLTAAAWQDVKTETLSVPLLAAGAGAGCAIRLFCGTWSPGDMMAGSMVGLILLLLGFASKEALGYGDGLLLSATGIFLGFQRNCLLLFCAVLCASLFSICLLTAGRKKKEDRIPFAPFVLAGFILQQLLQEGMVP